VSILWAALPPEIAIRFAAQGLAGREGAPPTLASRAEALERCEDELLDESPGRVAVDSEAAFASWLGREIGGEQAGTLLRGHLIRRQLEAGALICRQGEASDSIDLIALGTAAIVFRDADGREVRVRRMAGRTVIGEMGFFRDQLRTTSVVAESAVTLFTLNRQSYERLACEDPAAAARFLEFIVRQLADRVEFATKEIAALV
jgi:SulP family sulfate permease